MPRGTRLQRDGKAEAQADKADRSSSVRHVTARRARGAAALAGKSGGAQAVERAGARLPRGSALGQRSEERLQTGLGRGFRHILSRAGVGTKASGRGTQSQGLPWVSAASPRLQRRHRHPAQQSGRDGDPTRQQVRRGRGGGSTLHRLPRRVANPRLRGPQPGDECMHRSRRAGRAAQRNGQGQRVVDCGQSAVRRRAPPALRAATLRSRLLEQQALRQRHQRCTASQRARRRLQQRAQLASARREQAAAGREADGGPVCAAAAGRGEAGEWRGL